MKFWISCALGFGLMLMALAWGFSQWNLRYYTDYIGDRLELLAELRRGAMVEYFETAQAELRFWSKNEQLLGIQQQFNQVWQGHDAADIAEINRLYVTDNPNPAGFLLNLDDAEDGSEYSALHARVHPVARLFVTQRGYYDFFLIGPQGDIYYSVEKERDFATNLQDGPWSSTALAQAFSAAKKGESGNVMVLSDMREYGPSGGAPAMFAATALHDDAGEFIGVLALQLPTDRIIGIMAYTAGMGETGETYLVGEDLLMRSDSRFSEDSTILAQSVSTPAVSRALAGERGREMIDDYRGVPVLSGFVPLELGLFRWSVMAEMDQAEISAFAAEQQPPLGGVLALIYGLSLWTVWYWRGRRLPEDSIAQPAIDLNGSDASGGLDS